MWIASGALQNTDHLERFVVVLNEADLPGPMGDDNGIAGVIAQGPGHLCTEDCIEDTLKDSPARQLQSAPACVAEPFEVIGICSHHPIPVVRIPEGNGDRPLDFGVAGDLLITLPRNVVGGIPDSKNGIEEKLNRTAPGPHNQIGPRYGFGKACPGLFSNALNAEEQGHAQRNRDNGQYCREPSVAQTLQCKRDHDP